MEGVERFQQQLELVSMIDNEDTGSITSKVKECVEKDPGAFEEEAMVIEVSDSDDDEDSGEEVKVVSPETALIEARMRNIQTEIKMIGAIQRNLAGDYAGKVQGIMVGMVFAMLICGISLIIFYNIGGLL